MDQRIIKTDFNLLKPQFTDPLIPDYLKDTYDWAYINPTSVSLLDREIIVWAILWGNSKRLMQAAFEEIKPGSKVLQAANVYGNFSSCLAQHIGEKGHLDVIDIIPLQVNNCQQRLLKQPWARARLADAANPGGGLYDSVCCYFLLHEMPHGKRIEVLKGLLNSVAPGGRAIFIDYHKPVFFHPLKGIMNMIWRKFEPYAIELTETEIMDIVDNNTFSWSKETLFGGLYQKIVATRI
jgi:ubiquinone/menaquinone biosynthesis C-methylase UbiE